MRALICIGLIGCISIIGCGETELPQEADKAPVVVDEPAPPIAETPATPPPTQPDTTPDEPAPVEPDVTPEPEVAPVVPPVLTVETPTRGAQLTWEGEMIKVTGTVSPADGVAVTVNGIPAKVIYDGSFEAYVVPGHGMNRIETLAVGADDGEAADVRHVLVGDGFYPTMAGTAGSSRVSSGVMLGLSAEVWDDNDLADADDVATLVTLVLDGVDLMALVGEPKEILADTLWCDGWTLTINDISYKVGAVDLVPDFDALHLKVTLTEVSVAFDAIDTTFGCPDAQDATLQFDVISIAAKLGLGTNDDGEIQVTVENADVTLDDPQLTVEGGFLSAFDGLVTTLAGATQELLEGIVATMLEKKVAPLLGGVLRKLASIQKTIEVGPLAGLIPALSLTVDAAPAGVTVKPTGLQLVVDLGLSAQQGELVTPTPAGALSATCLGKPAANIPMLPPNAPVALSLSYDVLNQALFSAWFGGAMHIQLDSEQLADIGLSLPYKEPTLELDPLLPPVLTGCTDDGTLHLQVGAMAARLSYRIPGAGFATAEAMIGLELSVELGITTNEAGKPALELKIVNTGDVALQVVDAIDIPNPTVVENFLSTSVNTLIVDKLAGGIIKAIALPDVALDGLLPGAPEGTSLTFHPQLVVSAPGYAILTGALVSN